MLMQALESDCALLGKACRERFFAKNPDLEMVVTDDPLHIGYLSGYRSVLQDMPPYAQFLVATGDRIALVTGASDAPAALEVLGDPGVIWRYGTFFVYQSDGGTDLAQLAKASETPAEALAAALSTFRPPAQIGVELGHPHPLQTVQQSFQGAALVPVSQQIRQCRAVKLPGELAMMRHVSKLTDTAIAAVHDQLRAGLTELDIAAEISGHIIRGGGVPRFVVVTSGVRGALVDAYATGRRLAEGDIVRIDVGATFKGYYSDMARTYAVGDPGALAIERYDALLRGELAELDLVKAGIPASAVFEKAVREVRSGKLPDYQRNHCGHGLGLRAHEFPLIGPQSETILEAGMVLCLETPYYELGWGGMMVEDTVIVTASGNERLTHAPRSLLKLASRS